MGVFILLLILIPLITWIASVYLLAKWTKFKYFFLINLIILITYLGVLILGKNIFWDTDPYGLGILFRLAICIISHIFIVFIFALFKRKKK